MANNANVSAYPKSPRAEYNESLVINAGLNLKLSSGLYLTDLLRLEFRTELSISLVEHYLK